MTRTYVHFYCPRTGEAQTEVLCERCEADLTPFSGENKPQPADEDTWCTYCGRED